MPYLTITIKEVKTDVPDNPDKGLAGYETKIEGFYEDGEETSSFLPQLAPLFEYAISRTLHAAFGDPIHAGDGDLETSTPEAIKKAVAKSLFPSEI